MFPFAPITFVAGTSFLDPGPLRDSGFSPPGLLMYIFFFNWESLVFGGVLVEWGYLSFSR